MSGLRFHPEARREYLAAVLLHERERPGYGQLFIDAVEQKVEQAARLPASGTLMPGVAGSYEVRRYRLDRFSFKLVVAVIGGEPIVLALAHDARRPLYWRRRLGRR